MARGISLKTLIYLYDFYKKKTTSVHSYMLQVEFGHAWDVLVCLVQGFHNMRLKISHIIPRLHWKLAYCSTGLVTLKKKKRSQPIDFLILLFMNES